MTLHFKSFAVLAAVAACGLLSACRTAPTSLYQWEGYQPQVYEHFKGGSAEQQIAVLEKDLQAIDAGGKVPPPGYHAHLGYLYSMTGKQDQMVVQFQEEKKLFPESAVYMDFLMAKIQKSEK
ncbi:MAG: DUF4810 domain-containing protein [Pseudomonadota bacterium]